MTQPPRHPGRRRFLTLAAAGLALPAIRRGASRGTRDRPWIPSDRLLERLPRLMDLASVPGLGIAVVEGGEAAWQRGIGLANAETRVPVDQGTVFPAASLGKPVFGYVVMKLAEEGLIGLDRPLASVFRPGDLADDARLDRITPRHVLSHTTGLPNWRSREGGAKLEPAFEPGTRFQYSGEGFFWLQRVVETVTGQGVDRVMRERLFGPAAMPRATYGWSADHRAWTAYGHDNRGAVARQFGRAAADPLLDLAGKRNKPFLDWTAADVFRAMAELESPLPALPNFAIPNVAGSLLCTAGEYARFLASMLGGRRAAAWEISEASRTAMLTPRVTLRGELSWGLGWGLESTGSAGRLFWHWGDNGTFRAFTLGDPARRRAIVVFTNGQGGPKLYQRIVTDATGLDLAAFVWV